PLPFWILPKAQPQHCLLPGSARCLQFRPGILRVHRTVHFPNRKHVRSHHRFAVLFLLLLRWNGYQNLLTVASVSLILLPDLFLPFWFFFLNLIENLFLFG